MFHVVVRLSDREAVEGRGQKIVQSFKAAPLHQFGEAALQGDFHGRVCTKGGKHSTGLRVHQGDTGHRELAAEGRIFNQHRKTLRFQRANAFENVRVLFQYVQGHVRERYFFLNNLLLYRPFKNF